MCSHNIEVADTVSAASGVLSQYEQESVNEHNLQIIKSKTNYIKVFTASHLDSYTANTQDRQL